MILTTCPTCGERFPDAETLREHRQLHNPLRTITSRERPKNRGPIPCGHCEATFSNPRAAKQHRRDKHGIAPEPEGGQHGIGV